MSQISSPAQNFDYLMKPETSLNEDGSVNIVTAINYQNLLIQEDHVSQILNEKNPALFSSLENLIEIDSVALLRKDVNSRRALNRVGVLTGDLPSVNHKTETVITTGINEKGKIEPKVRFVLNSGVSHTVNPQKIKKTEEGYRGKDFHIDASDDAKPAAEVQEINLTSDKKMVFLAFLDNSVSYESGNKKKYGIEISFTAKTVDFVKNVVGSLEDTYEEISSLQKASELPGYYDYEKLTWKEDFFVLMNTSMGYDIKMSNGKIEYNSGTNSTLKNSAIWIKGPSYYSAALTLLGKVDSKIAKKLFSLLNPVSSTPGTLLSAQKTFQELVVRLKKVYDLGEDSGNKYGLQTSNKRGMKTRSGLPRRKHVSRRIFKQTLRVTPQPELGMTFVGAKKGSFPVLTKTKLRKRVRAERNKFFKGTPSAKGSAFKNLTNKEKRQLLDLKNSSYAFFTPMEIKVGNSKKSLLEINETIFDDKFFTQFGIAKALFPEEADSNTVQTLSEEVGMSNIATEFGLTIAPAISSVAEEQLQSGESFHKVTDYLGDNSYLRSDEEPSLKLFLPTFSKEEREDSKKLMTNFANLKSSSKPSRDISLKNFDLGNKKSSFNKLIGSTAEEDQLSLLPVAIKALLIDSKENKSVRFSLTKGPFDPLSNLETREGLRQNFLNIKKLEYLAGFVMVNGRMDPSRPIWKMADADFVSKNPNYLCRLVSYSPPAFGKLLADKKEGKIPVFDSLFLLKGRGNG